jgi:hypothetical protein
MAEDIKPVELEDEVRIMSLAPMMALDYMIMLNNMLGGLRSTGNPGEKASKSEIRRWLQQSSVMIDGVKLTSEKTMIKFPIKSLVLFPKSETKRITIF